MKFEINDAELSMLSKCLWQVKYFNNLSFEEKIELIGNDNFNKLIIKIAGLSSKKISNKDYKAKSIFDKSNRDYLNSIINFMQQFKEKHADKDNQEILKALISPFHYTEDDLQKIIGLVDVETNEYNIIDLTPEEIVLLPEMLYKAKFFTEPLYKNRLEFLGSPILGNLIVKSYQTYYASINQTMPDFSNIFDEKCKNELKAIIMVAKQSYFWNDLNIEDKIELLKDMINPLQYKEKQLEDIMFMIEN